MDSKDLRDLFLKVKNITLDDVSHIDFDLYELLILEKERLGFKKTDLVFVSAGDLSKFYWCPMQTYFTLMENEADKFSGYLQDKIEYSIKLGKLDEVPKNKGELLLIGDDIVLDDIFDLLKLKEYQNGVNSDCVADAKRKFKNSKSPMERGHYLETIYAKKFPQIHWVSRYDDFIFTCEPDGIAEDFVYEFKSSKNSYFSKFSIKKAKLQSDIYAICFDKKKKLIEQFIVSEKKIISIEEEVDISRVDFVLSKMKEIISGDLPLAPSEKFKCRGCKYYDDCKIK